MYPKGISNATESQRGSFCDLGNQAVTDSRNEAWKTLEAFWYFSAYEKYR